MRKSWFVSAVLLILVMLLTSVVSAQDAPRVIPTNDNFVNAKPIKIGKNYSVPDIEGATVEAGQPAVTPCGAATIIYHSVWFSFYLSESSFVNFSTEGTFFSSGTYEMPDTVIAVFTGPSLGLLTQVACVDDLDNLLSELTLYVGPGTTYFVMVGSYSSQPLDASSTLKLNTRMKNTLIQFNNESFEAPLAPGDWKVKNGTGDDRVCGSVQYPPWIGVCAFRFMSGPSESSKLKQVLPFPGEFAPRKNGVLILTFLHAVVDAPLGPAKLTFKVAYTDGTPTSKRTFDLTGTNPTPGYSSVTRSINLVSGKVASLTLEVSFKSTTGALMVDGPFVYYFATSGVRDGVLPPP